MSSNPAPVILGVANQPPQIAVQWFMTGITPDMPFLVTITNTQSGATNDYPAEGTFAQITQQLVAGQPYTVKVAQITPPGPASNPVPIVTAGPPSMLLVANNGDALQLKWQGVPGQTTYSAVVQEGNKTRSFVVTGTEHTFPGAIEQPAVTAVSVATADGVSTGPSQSWSVILDTPSVRTVQNTGTGLWLIWNLIAGYANYQAALQEGSGTPNLVDVVGPTYTFQGALGGSAYSTWVRAASDDGVRLGPPSRVYHPILVQPAMELVENTSAALNLRWARLETYTRYVAVLAQTGHQTLSKSVAALGTSFDIALSGPGWQTNVSAQSDDGILIGPPGTTYTPIVGQPSVTELDYVTGAFALTWQKIAEAVTGYVVRISGAGGSNDYEVPDSDRTTLPVTLQPVNYGVLIRGKNGIVLGPWSATRVPLTARPEKPRLLYDGTHLIAYWSPSGQSGVTGYVAELQAGGTPIQQTTPPQSPQPFESNLTNGVVFRMQVRSTGPGTKGPWSDFAPGPYGAAMVYSFDAAGRIHTVQWNTTYTQTYTFDAPGSIEGVQYTTT
jgi:hypothetical protein